MNARVVRISNDEYHRSFEVSKSDLALFADAPRLYQFYKRQGHPSKPPTDSMIIGSAAHAMALEPELFRKLFYIVPELTPDGKKLIRSTAHKFEGCWNNHVAAAGLRTILREQDIPKIEGIAGALIKNPTSRILLESRKGQPGFAEHAIEQSIFWTDDEWGIDCRCKPDDLRSDDVCLDLKVTESISPAAFAKSAADFMYDLSVAHIAAGFQDLTGRPLKEYVFICVSQTAPYLISCFSAMEKFDGRQSVFDIGNHRRRNLLRRMKDCLQSDHWPEYVEGVVPMSFPPWVVKEIEKNSEGM